MPQSSEPSTHTPRCVRSLGKRFSRQPGVVKARTKHFEGRAEDVVGSATILSDELQQLASLDAHLPPLGHFHALQQAAPSPYGETQINFATSTSQVAALSWPWPSHGQKASESSVGSTYGSKILDNGSEISAFSMAMTGSRPP